MSSLTSDIDTRIRTQSALKFGAKIAIGDERRMDRWSVVCSRRVNRKLRRFGPNLSTRVPNANVIQPRSVDASPLIPEARNRENRRRLAIALPTISPSSFLLPPSPPISPSATLPKFRREGWKSSTVSLSKKSDRNKEIINFCNVPDQLRSKSKDVDAILLHAVSCFAENTSVE